MAKRMSIDFAIINWAVIGAEENRVVMNGVYPMPCRAIKDETILNNNEID